MSTIPSTALTTVKQLYYQKEHSAREIAKKLDVSIDAVYYFMRHHQLKRRSFSEDSALRFSKKKPSFDLKKNLTSQESYLKVIGTVLYWGEGYKSETATIVDFANSDPAMVECFASFLRTVCGIDESKLRVLLYCYHNQNVEELISFWSNKLHIPKKQFSKPYIRSQEKKSKRSMLHGLVHIRYGDKKLLLLIKKWIMDLPQAYVGR